MGQHGGKEISLPMCNTLHSEFAIIHAVLASDVARVSSFCYVGYTSPLKVLLRA